MNLIDHIFRLRDFSNDTFGPGERVKGILDHIRKELNEIEKEPKDVMEWIDVVQLALDGAWRAGYSPEEVAAALKVKQAIIEKRNYPDWRTSDMNTAIEHIRERQ